MCKLFGLEAAARVADRALLVHGGIGFTRGHAIERLLRDARLNWVEEGTPAIQQMVIADQVMRGAVTAPHPLAPSCPTPAELVPALRDLADLSPNGAHR